MFYLLRNLYLSCEHFGYDSTELLCLVDNQQYVNPSTYDKLLGLDPRNDGSKLFVVPYKEKTAKFYEEFRNVNATFQEFSYICIIALWSFHSLPEISESTKNLGNKIISEASAKLHEYYTNELRIANYASRHANLFKIAIMVEGIIRNKTEMLKARNLFNFGKNAFIFPKFEINYYSYKN
uniref:NR LBD domain-containing protein n=1 Tax=Panagrolaimus sp. PS1159 TaxID=55785 RepID=A0AC35F2S8_9BILA